MRIGIFLLSAILGYCLVLTTGCASVQSARLGETAINLNQLYHDCLTARMKDQTVDCSQFPKVHTSYDTKVRR